MGSSQSSTRGCVVAVLDLRMPGISPKQLGRYPVSGFAPQNISEHCWKPTDIYMYGLDLPTQDAIVTNEGLVVGIPTPKM